MGNLVEVVIDSLRVSLTNSQRVLVLYAKKEDRYLPIWIGPYEAESITIMLQEVEVARPLTHDLLKNVFIALHARLIEVHIHSLENDVFYAKIVTELESGTIEIDSRPSDAIALAIRAHIPILVESEILDKAGIRPEPVELEPADGGEQEKEDRPPSEPGTEKRLSIFEDFINQLDFDENTKLDDDKPDEKQ